MDANVSVVQWPNRRRNQAQGGYSDQLEATRGRFSPIQALLEPYPSETNRVNGRLPLELLRDLLAADKLPIERPFSTSTMIKLSNCLTLLVAMTTLSVQADALELKSGKT